MGGNENAWGITFHTRFERSPQSFAADRYFFVNYWRLFNIVIEYQNYGEDWELYNRLLESYDF
jgi:hypothetical protein